MKQKAVSVYHGHVMVIDRNGLTQWPILYEDGTVGWDAPERVSKTNKEEARKLLIRLREGN